MKNKKGFTLVELLAVIAILAILVIMALPAVLRMYRQARVNTFENEVKEVYRTAQAKFLSDSILLNAGENVVYTNETGCPLGTKTLDMTGNSKFKYYVDIDASGRVREIKATNGTYSYWATYTDAALTSNSEAVTDSTALVLDKILVEKKTTYAADNSGYYNIADLDSNINVCTGTSGDEPKPQSKVTFVNRQNEGQITPEDEVAIGEEHFYVVSSDATNTVLLAKYDLKSDGTGSYEQDTSGSNSYLLNVSYLDSNDTVYWDQCRVNPEITCTGSSYSGLLSKYANASNPAGTDLYTAPYPYVYDSNAAEIYPVVESYVNKISNANGIEISGRLMTYEEANSLSTNVSKDYNGSFYWIGTAADFDSASRVTPEGIVGFDYAYYTGTIRPVIIVSTSEI